MKKRTIPEGKVVAQASIAILITTLFWGFSYVSTKTLLNELSPLQIATARFALASLILLVYGVVTHRLKPLTAGDLKGLLLGTLFGIPIYFLLENYGIAKTNAGTASLLVATTPVQNIIFSSMFLHQKHPWSSWAGVFLSAIGVYIVVGGIHLEVNLEQAYGNLLVLGAAASWVIYTNINQGLLKRNEAYSLNFYQTVLGAICLVLLLAGHREVLPATNLNSRIWGNLLFLAVCCSAVAYLTYLFALNILGSTTVTTFLNFVPVCGVLSGIVFLGEPFGLNEICGGGIILSGIILVTKGCPKKNLPAENRLLQKG